MEPLTGAHSVQLRPGTLDDAPAVARVHVDSWRTTYHGIVPNVYLEQLSYERHEQAWRDILRAATPGEQLLVAEDDAVGIVGFADGGRERTGDTTYLGELYALYLLKSHQRLGLGTRLFRAVASHLIGRGLGSMLLRVLAANPAVRFYEAMGGRVVERRTVEIGVTTLDELSYGWTDLATLTHPPHLDKL